jgi:Xaa-Pro aminopeptidase
MCLFMILCHYVSKIHYIYSKRRRDLNMFESTIYTKRRDTVRHAVKKGIILLLGNDESPMNYADNTYHFRQDSSFLYYFGLKDPGLAATIDTESGDDILYGYEYTIDDVVWMGPQPSLAQRASATGIHKTFTSTELIQHIREAIQKGRQIHFISPYRSEHYLRLRKILGLDETVIDDYVSETLTRSIVAQRSIKTSLEIKEIEKAHRTTAEMHETAIRMAKPGLYERDLAGTVEGIALRGGGQVSFPVILSKHGETLHNHYHGNILQDGDLVVHDSGAESEMGYAADITRTFPVSGKFTQKQREIYEIVLQTEQACIDAIKSGIKNIEIHNLASRSIAEGLSNLGFMKGDIEDAVAQGAHALFFPHGIGHMLGLDVHDMENLGEHYVGYNDTVKRSEQFGLAYLRLAKELKPGFVLTIEPGIYFIPALIDSWRNEGKFESFINYDRVEEYKSFGGIRIEDDVLVTKSGHRVLGKPIAKSVADVESLSRS